MKAMLNISLGRVGLMDPELPCLNNLIFYCSVPDRTIEGLADELEINPGRYFDNMYIYKYVHDDGTLIDFQNSNGKVLWYVYSGSNDPRFYDPTVTLKLSIHGIARYILEGGYCEQEELTVEGDSIFIEQEYISEGCKNDDDCCDQARELGEELVEKFGDDGLIIEKYYCHRHKYSVLELKLQK